MEKADEMLFEAVRNNDRQSLLWALMNGADVNAVNDDMEVPLSIASWGMADLLIGNGADIHYRDETGATLLHSVSDVEFARCLLENGLDANARDALGATPLFFAKTPEIAQALLEYGADLNALDSSGGNALFSMGYKTATAKFLLDRGLDVNHRDNNGRTCIRDTRSIEMLDLFYSYGADAGVVDSKGRTALDEFISTMDMLNRLGRPKSASFRKEDDGIIAWMKNHGVKMNIERKGV